MIIFIIVIIMIIISLFHFDHLYYIYDQDPYHHLPLIIITVITD